MGRLGTSSDRCNTSTHSWTSAQSTIGCLTRTPVRRDVGQKQRRVALCSEDHLFFLLLSTSERGTGVRSKYSGCNSSSVFRELRDKNWKKEEEKNPRRWGFLGNNSIFLHCNARGRRGVSLPLPPFFHFFFSSFWPVPQPPVRGKHTLHILQTRVFREEIERKLCRKSKKKKSVSPSRFLCLSVAHFTQRMTPCFQFTSNYLYSSLKMEVKAVNNTYRNSHTTPVHQNDSEVWWSLIQNYSGLIQCKIATWLTARWLQQDNIPSTGVNARSQFQM